MPEPDQPQRADHCPVVRDDPTVGDRQVRQPLEVLRSTAERFEVQPEGDVTVVVGHGSYVETCHRPPSQHFARYGRRDHIRTRLKRAVRRRSAQPSAAERKARPQPTTMTRAAVSSGTSPAYRSVNRPRNTPPAL